MTAPTVVGPAPRRAWRAALDADPHTLPEHDPRWLDGLTATGRYRDASRLYRFDDGRTLVVPLVARRGPSGAGGWLQSLPAAFGMGGVIGGGVDDPALGAVLADLLTLPCQRIAILPDPLRWTGWAGALSRTGSRRITVLPRRAHVLDTSDGREAVWSSVDRAVRKHVRKNGRDAVTISLSTGGAGLDVYHRLFRLSVDRWAGLHHEPRLLAHARARLRDPLDQLRSVGRALGEDFVVATARIDGRPVSAAVATFGVNAHYLHAAMDRTLVGSTGAGDRLTWALIAEALDRGCRTFHFGETGSEARLSTYKEKFGAYPVDYGEIRIDRLPWTRADAAARAGVKKLIGFRDV